MSRKVVVTGMGIIASIGDDAMSCFEALLNEHSSIDRIKHIPTRHKDNIYVGEVKYSDEELYSLAAVSKDTFYTRTALLGIIAARQAANQAKIEKDNTLRTGLISATTVGGMAFAETHYKNYLNTEVACPELQHLDTHECGDSTERIADILGIRDHISTISTACSSSANSILFGARLIKHGLVDRVIVGGTDALSRHTINGFMALKILDNKPSQPFDAERQGLNLGEGSAFLVLESAEAAKGKEILAYLSGYGNANDAYHQTASSPDGTGAYLAMKKALEVANLKASDIDYINAHGTGTEINDLSEGIAVMRLFGNKVPPISSTKCYTGHTLGASGAIEAVFSILALQKGKAYANLRQKTQMPELDFPVLTSTLSGDFKHILSNSFGFGGNSSALLFSKA